MNNTKPSHRPKNSLLSNGLYALMALCLSIAPTTILHAENKAEAQQATGQNTFSLSGLVLDDANEPIPGASVVIRGTTVGTQTDADGRFTLQVRRGNVLEVNIIGFQSKTINVENQRNIQVVLKPEATELEDVVVTGYGAQQKKISVVGSVQSVRPQDLRTPSTQLSAAFAGNLPGVIAVQRSGQPGSDGANFWIRGISTFGGRTTPLIIVDGVEMSAGDLNNIDPEVIESFSLLKDATATAIYGTLGANGVLIVTTKSGKDLEKPRINVRLETTLSVPTSKPKFVSGVRFMEMYNEATKHPSSTSYMPYSESKIEATREGKDPIMYPNVDWYKELFNDYQMSQKAVINITGGTKRVDYFSSLSASHEGGMVRGRSQDFFSFSNDIHLWKYNFQNNLNMYLHPNTKLSVRLNLQLKDWKSPIGGLGGSFGNIINTSPVDYPVLYPSSDRDRNKTWTEDFIMWGGHAPIGNTSFPNPVIEQAKGYQTAFESTVISQVDLEQKLDFITKGLKFKGFVSFKNWSRSQITRSSNYNRFYVKDRTFDANGNITNYTLSNVAEEPVSTVLTQVGNQSNTQGDRTMYIQGILDYNRSFNKEHNVGAMVVYNQREFNVNQPSGLLGSLPQRKQGIAGRLTYSYKYRYLLEGNFGASGSENFAKGHQWGIFPSIALGWNISEEKFWEPFRDVISNFKIRGSWGLVGNDSGTGGRFTYRADINLQDGSAGFNTGRELNFWRQGPSYKRYENLDLTWEVGEKINLGVDLQLFRDLNLVFEVYKEHRRDIFMQRRTIPNLFGTSGTTMYGNLGEVENKGFELSFNYNRKFSKDLFVSARGSFTYAANEVLKYDEPDYLQYPGQSHVGHALNQPLLYRAERLFIDDADIANSPKQVLGSSAFVVPGDIKYTDIKDVNGIADGQIDGNDREFIGHPTVPEIIYGFGGSVRYKNWEYSLFFQGAARTSLVMSGFHPFGSNAKRQVLQFIDDDYWSETNQNIHAQYPRLSIVHSANNNAGSTFWQRDASFLKLKNMEVAYNFSKFRVYLSGSNLLTFSKFKLWDPERGGGSGLSYPTVRSFNLGVQVTL